MIAVAAIAAVAGLGAVGHRISRAVGAALETELAALDDTDVQP